MKTKIIYISGNELFEIADIRAAFEEVRTALSLGPDTVLFGVPVDTDDALAAPQNIAQEIKSEPTPTVAPVVDDIPETTEAIVNIPNEKPVKRRSKSAKVVPISDAIHSDPVVEEPTPVTAKAPDTESESVAPILSILGAKSEDKDTSEQNMVQPETTEPTPVEQTDIEPVSVDIIDDDVVDADTVTIDDMIADEAPTEEHEKTLEELLESMTPLGEDSEKPTEQLDTSDTTENVEPESDSDTDITLEKLATEFFENQDKIGTIEKPATRGKIGKLKNILPFKKAKHDDSGLMGDLFGWAGAAANDEDFTIPGFFK